MPVVKGGVVCKDRGGIMSGEEANKLVHRLFPQTFEVWLYSVRIESVCVHTAVVFLYIALYILQY